MPPVLARAPVVSGSIDMKFGLVSMTLFLSIIFAGCGRQLVVGEACAMLPGDLVISEIFVDAVGSDTNQEWFEVYNATSHALVLDRLELSRLSKVVVKDDGTVDATRQTHVVRFAGAIDSGSYYVFGDGRVGEQPINYSYRAENNVVGIGNSIGAMGKESGGLELRCAGKLIDRVLYDQKDNSLPAPPDESGKSMSFEGLVAPDALGNDLPEMWCSGGDPYDAALNTGTPGRANIGCGQVRCTEADVSRDARMPNVGDVVLNEFLVDAIGNDSNQLWIEVAIAAGANIDLNGVRILSLSNDPEQAPRSALIVRPSCVMVSGGELVVLAESLDTEINGGVVADVAVPKLSFGQSFFARGGAIELRIFDAILQRDRVIDRALIPPIVSNPSGPSRAECLSLRANTETDCEVDAVDAEKRTGCTWDAASTRCLGSRQLSGRALGLDGAAEGVASANDIAGAFCYAEGSRGAVFEGWGTPGQTNGACGTSYCMGQNGMRPVRFPEAGELLINEVHADPSSSDRNREWIEVRALADDIDLNGLVLTAIKGQALDGTSFRSAIFSDEECIRLANNQLAILGLHHEDDISSGLSFDTGGVVADIVAPITYGTGFLDNGPMVLQLFAAGVVDMALLPEAQSGMTQMLDPALGTLSTVNDDPSAFCSAVYGGIFEDLGSPHMANICPTTADIQCVDVASTGSAAPGARGVLLPAEGDVVINELLVDAAGSDTDQLWIELAIGSSNIVELNGLRIMSRSNDSTQADRSFTLARHACMPAAAGSLVVLAETLNTALNGNVQADYAVPELRFGQRFFARGGVIELWVYDGILQQERLIDRAAIPPVPSNPSGPSLEACAPLTEAACEIDPVEPTKASGCKWDTAGARCLGARKVSGRSLGVGAGIEGMADRNDAPGAFCYARGAAGDVFSGWGTPGQTNAPCDTAMCIDGTSLQPRLVQWPGPGDALITEIESNPSGTDRNKEWFEVRGATGSTAFDLNGLLLRIEKEDGSSFRSTILSDPACIRVTSGDFAVVSLQNLNDIGRSPDTGGIVADIVAPMTYTSGFFASNALKLELISDVSVDVAHVPAAASGVSAMLNPNSGVAPTANDDVLNFCTGETSGIARTPGAENVCP